MPLVSILVASKNQAHYLMDMISALKAQSFQDFEVIVVDSYSTDSTQQILTQYEKVKFIQRKCDANLAYRLALDYASGKYIMIATTSDFLYSIRWIELAVLKLESDDELSCVWGSGVIVDEDGGIQSLWADHYILDLPPSKNNYIYFWLHVPYLPELNYVVSSEVFNYCIKFNDTDEYLFNVNNSFLYNFTRCGFLQEYIPEIANAGRDHGNSLTLLNKKIDRDQSFLFFKLRFMFIINIYFKNHDFQYKNRKFEALTHYKLDNLLSLIFKFFSSFLKNILRKLIKKTLTIIYRF